MVVNVSMEKLSPRPWLDLYGYYLKPKAREGLEVELALIQKVLPDELVLLVLARVGPYSLASAACACRHWHALSEHPKLWEAACYEALHLQYPDRNDIMSLVASHKGSWKRTFVQHPHLRFDGLYVSRNTYVRRGTVELRAGSPAHLVAYYRYYRFFPDGSILYRTSPQVVSKIVKAMVSREAAAKHDSTWLGRYIIRGNKVFVVITYPNSRSTEIRTRLTLRSTPLPGANNRLDLESIVSYDRELGYGNDMLNGPPPRPDEEPNPGEATRREHSRGLTSAVFVPWSHVASTQLNLPPSEMDVYLTG